MAGTVADVLSLESEMTKPPTGATDVIVTVPELVFPPFTEVGLSVRDLTMGAVTVKVAV